MKIKGVALTADSISKNKRKYVREELKKAARSWIGKPVTINHDPNRIVGDIEWMEFEDPMLEYLINVKKQPYVNMFRNGDERIRGVSVQADYLYNQCIKCGERFYDEETFREHMMTEHFIKDIVEEPHGIKGTYLSVVVSPETPGVEGTTTELYETLAISRDGGLQLLETVTSYGKQQEKWKEMRKKLPAAVTPKKRVTPPPPKLKEQKPRTDAERAKAHFEISDEEWQKLTDKQKQDYIKKLPPRGTATEQEEELHGDLPPAHPTPEGKVECEEGSHWDEDAGTCVPDEIESEVTDLVREQEEEPTGEHDCGEGFVWDPTEKKCVPKKETEETEQELPEPTVKPPLECEPGFTYDADSGTCIPKEWPAEPTADTPAPLMVPEPTIEPAKVPSPAEPAPAVAGPVIEQDEELHGDLAPAPFPTASPEAPTAITHECGEGSHWDEIAGTCVPDKLPEPVVSDLVREARLPSKKMLTLGEPCDWSKAGYTSFADCEAKNQDKGDPAAYCADVKRKIMGETLQETLNLNKIYARDARLADEAQQLARNQKTIVETVAKLVTHQRKQDQLLKKIPHALNRMANESRQTASKILEYQEKQANHEEARQIHTLKETAKATKKLTKKTAQSEAKILEYLKKNAEGNKEFKKHVKETLSQLATSLAKRKQGLEKKLSQLATSHAKLAETQKRDKQIYERILDAKDGQIAKQKREHKTLEQQLKEQEDELEKRKCPEGEHYDEEKGECVPNEKPEETKELEAKVKELEAKVKEKDEKAITETEKVLTRIENLEARLKGNFKGQSKPIEPAEGPKTSHTKDLAKIAREKK